MELLLKTQALPYLRCSVRQTLSQEQTQELTVPDSLPDVSRMITCFASAELRSKQCRDGAVQLSGGVRASCLYAPPEQEQTPLCEVESYLPFTLRLEHPALRESSLLDVGCRVSAADARMINSRKILFRITVACPLQAFEEAELSIPTLEQAPAQLQTLEACYETPLCVELTERSFSLRDETPLSEQDADIAQLVSFDLLPVVQEQRLIGGKALFKGVLQLSAVYLAPEQGLHTLQRELPFSQYCELREEYDGEQLQVQLVLTGSQLEPVMSGAERKLLLSAELLAQCQVTRCQSIRVISDAYGAGAELSPQWVSLTLPAILDRQALRAEVHESFSLPAQRILSSCLYLGAVRTDRTQAGVRVSVPANINLVYLDEDGAIQGKIVSAGAACELPAAQNAAVYGAAKLLPGGGCEVHAQNAELFYEVLFSLETDCEQEVRTLSGGTLAEPAGKGPKRACVVLRTCAEETALWELGKQYAAPVCAIQAANHLQGQQAPAGTLLLIPV